MNLVLTRTERCPEGVFGELRDEAGELVCVTLERTFNGLPKLPPGTYLCRRGEHRLKHGPKFITFEITGVDGHFGILFHVANWAHELDGCVAVGTRRGRECVLASRQAFAKFMALQEGVDEFLLVVS